eukprot:COSAG03_NODE_2505_length_2691_cov_1.408179_1_plen_99_part_00
MLPVRRCLIRLMDGSETTESKNAQSTGRNSYRVPGTVRTLYTLTAAWRVASPSVARVACGVRRVRVRPCVSSESARSVMSWLRTPETAAVAQSSGSGG